MLQRHHVKYTEENNNKLIKKYIKNISNPAMKRFIVYCQHTYNAYEYPYLYFHPNAGLTNKDIEFLSSPTLKNICVGIDMDDTLHQTSVLIDLPIDKSISYLSNLLQTSITIYDLAEYYLGGKERMEKIIKMFQNLHSTIGIKNVFIITTNKSTHLKEIVSKLYSTICRVPFKKSNIYISDKMSKFEIIDSILN